ncbi:MAG: enoyl-CoA hydratase [Pseudomonadota bacterium]
MQDHAFRTGQATAATEQEPSSRLQTDDGTAPIALERRGAIAELRLRRPEARNALSLEMLNALISAIGEIDADEAIKAVILASDGPVFCAGHDLGELTAARRDTDGGEAFYRQTMETCARMMQAIVQSPKPFIAAVQGTATAAGCQLVATCDLAVASEDAKFCTPGVHIGLFCSTPMVALSRNVSRKHAMEMLLLGEMVPADRALDLGLINRMTLPADMMREAVMMAETIASKSGRTVAIGKRAFYEQLEMGLSDAYRHTADVMTRNMLERDAKEGINAFLEKRPPRWEG